VEVLRRWTSRMDAARGLGVPLKGPGMALVRRPWNGTGGERHEANQSGRRPDSDVGGAFFCLLFFAPGGDPQTKKSEAP
jgi:hypothetical protein